MRSGLVSTITTLQKRTFSGGFFGRNNFLTGAIPAIIAAKLLTFNGISIIRQSISYTFLTYLTHTPSEIPMFSEIFQTFSIFILLFAHIVVPLRS